MSLGRFTSDLEPGDDLGSLDYQVTPFVVREYCHSVENHQEILQSDAGGPQHWPVPLVHIDKLRFYARECPGGCGPTARIHYEFKATWSAPIKVGDRVHAESHVAERYTRKGRDYVVVEVVLRSPDDGKELVRYRDTALVGYRAATEKQA
jgi:hypothetical protein